jgi:hypothetical protein
MLPYCIFALEVETLPYRFSGEYVARNAWRNINEAT